MNTEGTLTEDSMMSIMREQKANQHEQFKIPYDKVKSVLKEDINPKKLEEIILKSLAEYQKKLNRERNKDAR
jgi:ParB family chromosome partitioning protein